MNQSDPIYSKVQAILDRANHPNTPREEAEVALAMAQKLILKHGLDEQAFAESSGDPLAIECERIEIRGAYAFDRLMVASTIARACSCAIYRSAVYESVSVRRRSGYEGFDHKKIIVLVMYGTKADLFAARTMWATADAMIARLLPQGDRRFKGSWIRGFDAGVASALRKAKSEIIQEQGVGAGLVLADKVKRADAEMRSHVTLRTTYRRTGADSGAYSQGRSAGSSFNASSIGGRQRALNS